MDKLFCLKDIYYRLVYRRLLKDKCLLLQINNRKICHILLIPVLILLVTSNNLQANQEKRQFQKKISSSTKVFKLTPQTVESALWRLKDTDIIELSGGKQISMKRFRSFAAFAKKLKSARKTRKPFAKSLRLKPATTGIRVSSLADLQTTLTKDDNVTVQLPSGRVATVAQIKFLQPLLEKRLGKKISGFDGRQGDRQEIIKLKGSTDKKYWKEILTKPEDTVLESPQGRRFTVGELKKFIISGPISGKQVYFRHK